jgi:hypothetical protein
LNKVYQSVLPRKGVAFDRLCVFTIVLLICACACVGHADWWEKVYYLFFSVAYLLPQSNSFFTFLYAGVFAVDKKSAFWRNDALDLDCYSYVFQKFHYMQLYTIDEIRACVAWLIVVCDNRISLSADEPPFPETLEWKGYKRRGRSATTGQRVKTNLRNVFKDILDLHFPPKNPRLPSSIKVPRFIKVQVPARLNLFKGKLVYIWSKGNW